MAKTNVKTIRIDRMTDERLSKIYGTAYEGATRAVAIYLPLRAKILNTLKGVFTKNELQALLDITNGLIFEADMSIHNSVIVSEIEDADIYEGLGTRHTINIPALIEKVKTLDLAQSFFLLDRLSTFWSEYEEGHAKKTMQQFIEEFE